jgi:hypothetical protein
MKQDNQILNDITPTDEEILNDSIPTDEELVNNAIESVNNLINNFKSNAIVSLKNNTYSKDIVWQYDLQKDLSLIKISFKAPYGYFSEDLIREIASNNKPIRKKLYFQVYKATERPSVEAKLKTLFNKQSVIFAELNQIYNQFEAELQSINEEETGEELQTQLKNLVYGIADIVSKIDLNDTFKYNEWVYNF